jgi:hypothetical protein
MKIKLILGLVGSLSMANIANAVDIYRTGFEANGAIFAPNSLLLDQDGWTAAIPPFLNPDAAIITNLIARSGSQSVEVKDINLISAVEVSPQYDAVGSYRKPVNYIVTPSKPVIKLEGDIKLETNQPVTTPIANDFFCATIGARLTGETPADSSRTLGETGLCSNGTATGALFDENPSSNPASIFKRNIPLNRWHHLTAYFNFDNKTIAYTVDDRFIGSTPLAEPNGAIVNAREILRGSMVVYVRPSGGSKGNYTARFDNFSMKAQRVGDN